MNNIKINEDQYLVSALTKACRLRNDQLRTRLPRRKSMLQVILRTIEEHFNNINQPYLDLLYQTLFSTAYFGLFWVSKLTVGPHQLMASDVHIATKKRKMLLLLRSCKTHGKNKPPQLIKIKATGSIHGSLLHRNNKCPFGLLKLYMQTRGGYVSEAEPFFKFRDNFAVTAQQFRSCFKLMLTKAGFQAKYYSTHSLRSRRSCDLYDLGLSVETIKKLGRWKSNTVFKYLRN